MARARLAEIDLPMLPRSDAAPELPASIHAERLERLRVHAAERGYDRLVVYADREHSASLAWLSGFDPPLSNIPAYLPPFLLRPDRAMTLAG